jgi:hypothetical protein
MAQCIRRSRIHLIYDQRPKDKGKARKSEVGRWRMRNGSSLCYVRSFLFSLCFVAMAREILPIPLKAVDSKFAGMRIVNHCYRSFDGSWNQINRGPGQVGSRRSFASTARFRAASLAFLSVADSGVRRHAGQGAPPFPPLQSSQGRPGRHKVHTPQSQVPVPSLSHEVQPKMQRWSTLPLASAQRGSTVGSLIVRQQKQKGQPQAGQS